MAITKFTRRARDEEPSIEEELEQIFNDPEADLGDVIAMFADRFPERAPEFAAAVREIGDDARGISAWAKDKRETRRYGRDALRRHAARVNGRDQTPPGVDPKDAPQPVRQGEDRRRMAGDTMAYDISAAGSFAKRFPGAARIERI